jgi:hypothetical protein
MQEFAAGKFYRLSSSLIVSCCARANGRGRAMRAWIDRTNDGLSGMPADGFSLPPKRGDFGTSRWGRLED